MSRFSGTEDAAKKLFEKREKKYLGDYSSPKSTMQNMIVKIDKLHTPVELLGIVIITQFCE